MGVSERTSKISSVVAVICIVVYILAITFGAVRIIENIGERRNKADSEFHDLADRASSSAVILGFMSEAYQVTIQDYLNNSKTLEGIIISGPDAEYAFERETGNAIVWAGDSPRFKAKTVFRGDPFYLPLRIEGQRNVNIQAIYNTIDYGKFLWVLRNTLLVVLAALVVAFITLIIELAMKNKAAGYRPAAAGAGSKSGGPKSPIPARKREEPFKPVHKPGTEANTGFHQTEINDEAINDETINDKAINDKAISDEAISDEAISDEAIGDETASGKAIGNGIIDNDVSFDEVPPGQEDTGDPDFPVERDNSPEPDFFPDFENPEPRAEQSPQGLYTPRGNVGWESYTLDRLSSELQRCASSEQDLVFLAMEFRGAEKTDAAFYRRFTDEAVGFFSMRDMIFEKGEKGICVIIPNIDLEHGIVRSEEFRSRINVRLNEYFMKADTRAQLFIGLSSRSGRLIEAKRLMLEASRALEKAVEDPVSPVIAFKSDPEKYREFILKNASISGDSSGS